MSECALKTSVGKKMVMAVTGLALVGFVVAHLLGNLSIYGGPGAINAYAEKLRHLGPLLWVARIGLITMAGLHIVTAICLVRENRAARPVPYVRQQTVETTYAARTMAVSGLIILAFIIYHLMHFTFRVTNPDLSHLHDALGRDDVYTMVVRSFQQPVIAGFYIVAQLLLASHLSHGLSSLLQSLGIHDSRTFACLKKAGCATAWLIFLGYVSIPVSVLLGFIKIGGGT